MTASKTTTRHPSDTAPLRHQAEVKLKQHKKHAPSTPLTKTENRRLVHELEVHQVELELQNEELQSARAELEAALHLYTDLYDFAPVGYFTLARDGGILRANLAGAMLLGAERATLHQRRFGLFIAPASRPGFNVFLEQAARSPEKVSCEVALLNSRPELTWVRMEATRLDDAPPVTFRCAVVDISEHRRAEERLAYQALLLENVHDAVVGLDDHFVITSWNRGAERLYGWTAAEAIGRLGPDMLHTETTAAEQMEIAGMLDETGHFSGQVIHHGRDGRRLYVEAGSVALRDPAGRVSGYVSAYRDVSDQKRAESELRLQVEILQLIFEQIPVMITFKDANGRIKFVNREWERTLGWTQAEIEQLDLNAVLVLTYPDPKARQRVKDWLTAGLRVWADFETQARDGQVLATRWAAVQLSDGTSIAFGQDVSAQKQADAMQTRLAAIVHDSDDAIYSKNLQGVLLSWNAGAEKLYGYTAAEAIGQSVAILIPSDHRDELADILERIGRGERLQHYETTRVRKDGAPIQVSLTLSPVRDAAGQISGISAIARDMSERQRAETALRQANDRLRAMSTRLSEVQEMERLELARELHDQVGQNLSALNINLNILRAQVPPGAADPLDQRIADSLALVRETTARTRQVMVELHPPLLDDYGLIAALRAHVDRLTQRLNLAIVVVGDEPAPPLPAAVAMTLFRVAQEALSNVAKHAGASQVNLTLESTPDSVRLTIADNGIGIDLSARREPNSQSGWGLVTMRERAEALGGWFQLQTQPGQGMRITIEVPR